MALRQSLGNVITHHHSMEEVTALDQLVRKSFASEGLALVSISTDNCDVIYQVVLFTACLAFKH